MSMVTDEEAYQRLYKEITDMRQDYNNTVDWPSIETDGLVDAGDADDIHQKADAIMIELLRAHGYDKFCDLFERLYKWYS